MKNALLCFPFALSSAVLLFMGFASMNGCTSFKGYTPDNPAEELLEDIIEKETGVELDLSPSSPEAPKGYQF